VFPDAAGLRAFGPSALLAQPGAEQDHHGLRDAAVAREPLLHGLDVNAETVGELALGAAEPLERRAELRGGHGHGWQDNTLWVLSAVVPIGYHTAYIHIMARRVCAWCGKGLGIGPGPEDAETHGICPECQVRFECEEALAHALVGLRAITEELERARSRVWPEGGPGPRPMR
jgi:hypothetical protein